MVGFFGVVYGGIGMCYQVVFVGGIGWVQCDVQVGVDLQFQCVDYEGFGDGGDDVFGYYGGIFWCVDLEYDDKFVVVQLCEGVLGVQQCGYVLVYLDQQFVVELVVVGVIDGFEIVQIVEYYCEGELVLMCFFDCLFDMVLQQYLVW